MNEYKIRLYNTSGVLKAEITDFLGFGYTKMVNAPGMLDLDLSGYNLALSNISKDCQLEVWRRPTGQSWYRDFIGLVRKMKWKYTDRPVVNIAAPGLLSYLDRRINAYYANLSNRTKFTSAKAETIANTLVKYNATSSASIGRMRSGAISGLSVETDGAEGSTLDWFNAYDNLLETLQELCRVGGGDFDIVKLTSTTYEWRWYTGQLGTDRSATVVFSMGVGNMAEPEYDDDFIEEKTAAIVGGKGEEGNRAYVVRTGTNYDTNLNNIEVFVNATNVDTTAGLQTAGDAKLDELRSRPTFTFKCLQVPSTLYGVHYFLGDLVAAINPFLDVKAKYKVQEVTVGLEKNGSENIEVEFEYSGSIMTG